jgi:hypothetical protein
MTTITATDRSTLADQCRLFRNFHETVSGLRSMINVNVNAVRCIVEHS